MAILALDEIQIDQRILKASYGMTKYCTYFLTNQNCFNSDCSYLHQISNDKFLYQSQSNGNQKKLLKISHEQIMDDLILENAFKKYEKAADYQLQDIKAFPSPLRVLTIINDYKSNLQVDNSVVFVKKKSKTKSKIKEQKKKITIKPLKWDDDLPQDTAQKQNLQSNENEILVPIDLKKCQSTMQNKTVQLNDLKKRTKSLEKNNLENEEISELEKIIQEHEKEFTKLDKNILIMLTKSYQKIKRQKSRYQFASDSKSQSQKDCQHIKNLIQNFLDPVDKLLKPVPQKPIKHDFHLFHQSYHFPEKFGLDIQLTYLRQLRVPLALKGSLQLSCKSRTSQIKQIIHSEYFTSYHQVAQFFQCKLLHKILLPLSCTTLLQII